MNGNKGDQKRTYNRVSDEQRSILIDLMSQNEHMSIKDASDLLSINYQNAKSIWNIYRSEGRKYNVRARMKPATFQPHKILPRKDKLNLTVLS